MGRIADSINGARVLVYDIETRPMTSMHWGARDQNISPAQVLDAGGVLCWAAKWLGESRIMFASDHHDGHERMVERLWGLLDDADVVIGYNQVSFDDKRMAVEFKRSGLPVPAPVTSIDLLKAVRARFGFPINKLQQVAAELGLGSKVEHSGWDMWRACCTDEDGYPFLGPTPQGAGCERHWRTMRRYCRQDVKLTEDVYWALRDGGWIKNHPHVGLHGGSAGGCGVCGSTELEPAGRVAKSANTYGVVRCAACGWLGRSARALKQEAPAWRNV